MNKSQQVLSKLSESDIQGTVRNPVPGTYESRVSGYVEEFTDSDGIKFQVKFGNGVRGLNIKSSVTVSMNPTLSIQSKTLGEDVESVRIIVQG